MRQYLDAVREILAEGTRKTNRTGVDTLSTFNINYEIDLRDGFPLLTTKEISWKNIVVEMLWFLSGRKDIGILKKHGCKFWDAWADPKTGEVPSAYGNFWRRFPVGEVVPHTNDQIAWAIEELKRNPMSRRVVVSAWAPANAQTSKLPPCHAMFVCNVQLVPDVRCTCTTVYINSAQRRMTQQQLIDAGNRAGLGAGRYPTHSPGCPEGSNQERPHAMKKSLCLHLTQRSCDIALGVPYNIASYALLLELLSRFTGIEAGIFAHTLVDAHAYTAKEDGSMAEYDHVHGLREQLSREPRPLPRLRIHPAISTLADVEALLEADTEEVMWHFQLDGYHPHPPISFKVAV